MRFTITVLGSSGMFATRGRACSGYLLRANDSSLWLDAGAGTWQRLLAHVDFRDLSGIILTHRHPDHTSDVFQAYHARQFGGPEPMPPIPLWAPQETIDALVGFVGDFDKSFDLRVVEDGTEMTLDACKVSFVKVAHPPETLGVRMEQNGAVFAYSSDTGPDANFERLASNADVFICEATFQDSDGLWEGHMSASQAATIASKCGVKKLVLTHLPPGRDPELSLKEARDAAGGVTVELAADGLELEIG